MVNTTAGLAMRSTDRATPLVLLSLAMLLGAGVSALVARVRRTGLIVGAGGRRGGDRGHHAPVDGAIIANGFTQPAHVPSYVHQAAKKLNSVHTATRVFAIPGNNFAAYRWGDTIDTVWPALLTRPFVTHEQQIMGSLPTADVLNAVDVPIQEGTMDWNALAPMASLMSAGDVLVQYDQAYERYDTPDPQVLASQLQPTPGRALRPRVLRRPSTQRVHHPPSGRGRTRASGQLALAQPPRVLHGGQAAAHSFAASPWPTPWWWTGTPADS